MKAMKLMVLIVAAALATESNGQYYKELMKLDPQKIIFWNASKPTFTNYNQYALENNGISYLVCQSDYEKDPQHTYDFYSGETLTLKFQTKRVYPYNNQFVSPLNDFLGFYDIDGDNVREAVMCGYMESNPDSIPFSYNRGIAFINIQTDQCEYFWENRYASISTFADINNDGYPEMIARSAVLGHSKTPQPVQPQGLSKALNPTIRLYPNPMTQLARIDYYVPSPALVKLKIFDLSGKLLRTLVDANRKPGDYSATWDGKNENGGFVSSGQYYYTIQINDFVSNKRVVVLNR